MHRRDWGGESSELLFGLSASLTASGWEAVRLWWYSANDISSPARIYRRDWEGESSELLYGVSESLCLPVGRGRLTWG